MKRSEMINKIAEIISEVTYPEIALKRAKRILNMMESEGVLPPKNLNKYDPVPTVTPTGNHDYSFIREWEPEDA